MPIASSDIIYRLSGGAANSDPNAALGGAKSSTAVSSTPANNIFDDVSSAESVAGDTEYRCIYVHNNHGTLTLQNARVFIPTNTTGNRIAVGAGTSAINGTEQTVANEGAAPTSVTFSQPTNYAGGVALGDIPAGQHKAVWFRRVIPTTAGASNDSWTYEVQGDTAA